MLNHAYRDGSIHRPSAITRAKGLLTSLFKSRTKMVNMFFMIISFPFTESFLIKMMLGSKHVTNYLNFIIKVICLQSM